MRVYSARRGTKATRHTRGRAWPTRSASLEGWTPWGGVVREFHLKFPPHPFAARRDSASWQCTNKFVLSSVKSYRNLWWPSSFEEGVLISGQMSLTVKLCVLEGMCLKETLAKWCWELRFHYMGKMLEIFPSFISAVVTYSLLEFYNISCNSLDIALLLGMK